jgi:hypothetical protein
MNACSRKQNLRCYVCSRVLLQSLLISNLPFHPFDGSANQQSCNCWSASERLQRNSAIIHLLQSRQNSTMMYRSCCFRSCSLHNTCCYPTAHNRACWFRTRYFRCTCWTPVLINNRTIVASAIERLRRNSASMLLRTPTDTQR